MAIEINKEMQLAKKLIETTNENIFLTGNAGTGKTTFLNLLRTQTAKRMVVLAPTGVAAINAKGQTIHSFFQLPFTPFLLMLFCNWRIVFFRMCYYFFFCCTRLE